MLNESHSRVLRPLWLWATGITAAILACRFVDATGPCWLHWSLVILGAAGTSAAIARRWDAPVIFLLAGLALGGGRGLEDQSRRARLTELIERPEVNLRIQATVSDGWTQSRWGARTRILCTSAAHAGRAIDIPRRLRVEVRGESKLTELPPPGTAISTLGRLRGTPESPLLVISSARIVERLGDPEALPHFRQRLVDGLFVAAGTDPERIRAAELVCALSVGRRDEMPEERVERWRRSGLGHMLAVSGLHVGLVSGFLWLILVVCGASPRLSRLVMLIAVPSYALLAGAPTSAVRAAFMVVIYLIARLLGRSVVPFGAVLLAAGIMLLTEPHLIADVGFQLTVLITAAIIRWTPAVAEFIPGPRWLGFTIAAPFVAQLAASPIAAIHFRRILPAAALANVLGPLLLTPTMALSLGAALTAWVFPRFASILLDGVAVLQDLLHRLGTFGGAFESVIAAPPAALISGLVIFGWTALHPRRWARLGAVCWLVGALLVATSGHLPRRSGTHMSLVPVSDGLAALAASTHSTLLFDTGRAPRETVELLADAGVRSVNILAVSHLDSDHSGGAQAALSHLEVAVLLVPAWVLREPAAVPMLRKARSRGVRVLPATAGLTVSLDRDGTTLDVLWPPVHSRFASGNERSLTARITLGGERVLLTADIGTPIERRLARSADLDCSVLVVAHHGSRTSTSMRFLEATTPEIALIPAGERNLHHHPSPVVLERLDALGIPYRYPARDGWCGAELTPDGWRIYP